MKAHISCYPDGSIGVLARAELIDSPAYGDWRHELKPGQGIGQYTYDQLRAHGSGDIDIDFAAEPADHAAA